MSRKYYYIVCNYLLFSAFLVFRIIHGAPVTNAGEAADHLIQYNYLERPAPGVNTDIGMFINALTKYQEAGNIPQTGELDDATLALMNTPRCGLPDNAASTSTDRSKRYVINSQWFKKHLTWNIELYTLDVSEAQLDEAISTSLKFWSDASGLTFTRVYTPNPDFIILFPEPNVEHGDLIEFDGKGNILAHAFFPGSGPLSGDAHFDNGETWTVKSSLGTSIVSVATHEFGHSIGLSHSTVYSSIMWPWSKPYDPYLELAQDDIDGVQAIYGPPSNAATRPPDVNQETEAPPNQPTDQATTTREHHVTKPTLAAIPSNCQVEFDTITVGPEGGTFVFKGKYYWQIVNGKVFIPKLISSTWPNLPSNLDAAVTVKNSYVWKDRELKTYFFKGRQVYRYSRHTLDVGFPVDISWEFYGFPDYVIGFDAVVEGIGNGQTYFFTGNQFFIYDYTERISGPFSIASFKGIPSSVVAGVQWTDNYIYFFTSVGWYYQFSPWNFNVNYGYPRLTVQDWFGCGAWLSEGESRPDESATEETIPGPNLDADNSSPRRTINFLTIFISFLLFIIIGCHQ